MQREDPSSIVIGMYLSTAIVFLAVFLPLYGIAKTAEHWRRINPPQQVSKEYGPETKTLTTKLGEVESVVVGPHTCYVRGQRAK